MKSTNDKVANLLLILLLMILEVLCIVPWFVVAIFVCKYLAIVGIFGAICGYLLIRGAYKQNEHEDNQDKDRGLV